MNPKLIIGIVKRVVSMMENKYKVHIDTEKLYADMPVNPYKNPLSKRYLKQLGIWKDVKLSQLQKERNTIKSIRQDYLAVFAELKEKIWVYLKSLTYKYSKDYVKIYNDMFDRAIASAKSLSPSKQNQYNEKIKEYQSELEDLEVRLNHLLYENQLWQNADEHLLDLDIQDVLQKIAKILEVDFEFYDDEIFEIENKSYVHDDIDESEYESELYNFFKTAIGGIYAK